MLRRNGVRASGANSSILLAAARDGDHLCTATSCLASCAPLSGPVPHCASPPFVRFFWGGCTATNAGPCASRPRLWSRGTSESKPQKQTQAAVCFFYVPRCVAQRAFRDVPTSGRSRPTSPGFGRFLVEFVRTGVETGRHRWESGQARPDFFRTRSTQIGQFGPESTSCEPSSAGVRPNSSNFDQIRAGIDGMPLDFGNARPNWAKHRQTMVRNRPRWARLGPNWSEFDHTQQYSDQVRAARRG